MRFSIETVNSSKLKDSSSEEIFQLPCFSEEVPAACLKKWEPHYDEYRVEMCNAMSINDEPKNIVTKRIYKKYKQILYGAAEFEESTRKLEEIFDEAVFGFTGMKELCGMTWFMGKVFYVSDEGLMR